MTPNEFKAWFDGFTEAFDGKIPTKAQWTRIQARVADIDGKKVTEYVYRDRYLPTYVGPYASPIWYSAQVGNLSQAQCYNGGVGLANTMGGNNTVAAGCNNFNSLSAMNQLGRAEAQTLAS